jgi:hypothetical protein
MPTLHSTKLSPYSWAATSAQDGYAASNVSTEQLGRPWRSTNLGANDVTIILPATTFIQTLFLFDVNFAAATIQKSVDNAAFVNVGAFASYGDAHGRRRGNIAIAAAGQLAVKVQIAAGASTDGLGYWRIGAAYLFGTSVNLAAGNKAGFNMGYRVSSRRPRTSNAIPNGLTAVAKTGLNVDRIEFSVGRLNTELLDDVVQKCSAATCLLDLQLPNFPHQQWPVRLLDETLDESYQKIMASGSVPLVEVVS